MSRIIEQAGLAVNVNERPPLRVKLPDGSSWPRPAIDADEWCGIGWRCRYAAESITRNDLLTLASIADAYGFLVCGTTQKRREYVTREIRRTLSHDCSCVASFARRIPRRHAGDGSRSQRRRSG